MTKEKKLEMSEGDWLEQAERKKEEIIDEVALKVSKENPNFFDGGILREDSKQQAEDIIRNTVMTRNDLVPGEAEEIVQKIVGQATGYGVLQEFFEEENEDITEIFINPTRDGPRVFYGKHGKPWMAEKQYFKNDDEVLRYCQRICDYARRDFNENSPIVDAWLPDGSRLAAIGFKASPLGVAATIRKSPVTRPPMELEKLVETKTLPSFIADFLVNMLVKGHANVGVFGRTDSGKTTFLRALGTHIDPVERTFIAETSFEMYMPNLPNCVNLVETVYGNETLVDMTQLCKTMNRNNPDRAIVGELRSKEIIAASQIASSTSGGFWTTGHAGNVNDLRTRLFGMFLDGGVQLPRDFLDEIIASMFHFVIFLDKEELTSESRRTLMSVVEVCPDGYNEVFKFDQDELAQSEGSRRRWIFKNTVTEEKMSKLAFSGAKVKPEYKKIEEKYYGFNQYGEEENA